MLDSTEINDLIEAAYRQIFFHAFKVDRVAVLESQLKNGQITVRDFVRGLLLSDTYKRSFYDLNNNYRFVEQTVQRVLGRDVYSEREKIAWSIIVCQKGYIAFVDALLDSEEYMDNFGYDILPYQRRRNLPGRDAGEVPFNLKSPRYEAYYRTIKGFPQMVYTGPIRRVGIRAPQVVAGDPGLFIDMARSITVGNRMSVTQGNADFNFLAKVPRR